MRAAVNVVGPHGELVVAGSPIPDDWPTEFRASLLISGGAVPEEVELAPGTEPPSVSPGALTAGPETATATETSTETAPSPESPASGQRGRARRKKTTEAQE